MEDKPFFRVTSNNPKGGDGNRRYIEQMEENRDTMRKFASGKWYRDVIEGPTLTFDAYTFLSNHLIQKDPHWRITWNDVVRLRRDEAFVKPHIQTMVYWLNACGFSAHRCAFFDKTRINRTSLHLKDHPRIARFIHSVNLFASIGEQPAPAIMNAYLALERATAAFIMDLKLFGSYKDDINGLNYKTPEGFLSQAGISSTEEELAAGWTPENLVKHASDLRVYAPEEILDGGPSSPSGSSGSTEGDWFSVWTIGAIGVAVIGVLLLIRLARRRNF